MGNRQRLLMGTLALVGGLLVWGAMAGGAWAQEAPKPEPSAAPQPTPTPEPRRGAQAGDVQRVFTLRHVDVGQMTRLLKAFPAAISYSNDPALPALAVSAKPGVMAVIEETIKRLDVPQPQEPSIEVTVHIVRAETAPGKPDSLPERLRSVATQLHALFDYSGYTVQDTLVARTSQGGAVRVSSRDPARVSGQVAVYEFRVGRATIKSAEKDPLIALEHVSLKGEFRAGAVLSGGEVNADIGLRPGQYVVIGKIGTGEEGGVLVLVLTARVVE